MSNLTAALLSKNAINNINPTVRINKISYRLIIECEELNVLINTLRSTISKNCDFSPPVIGRCFLFR